MFKPARPAALIALALAAVVGLALIGFPADAFAAVPAKAALAHFDLSHLGMASALVALRAKVTDLETRAAAKLAEVVDGLAPDAVRTIELAHATLLGELSAARAAATEAEVAERAAPAPSPSPAPATPDAIRQAERARQSEIRSIGAMAEMPAADIDAALDSNEAVEAFRAKAFNLVAARAKAKPTNPVNEARNGQDETETRREAMIEYIMFRAGRGALSDRAREMYRGMDAVDLARETLSWRGERVRGLLPDEIAQRSLMASSDFPSILAAGANKTLRQGYTAAPRTFTPWVRSIQLPDFKSYNIVRRGETPQLAKMNEKGEFKRGAIVESKETIKLQTYGVVAGMTRQMIVNDDLGAFLGIPGDFGVSSATLESDIVYGVFLSNPALVSDNVAVFHATHKNLAASGTALSIDSISAGRAAMSKMTGLDGKTILNVTPRYLLVPPELETKAEQLLFATILAVEAGKAVPESIRSLKPISEPRLSTGVDNKGAGVTASGSVTAHYLLSDMVDTILTATLEGQNGPYIETRMGFDVDGVEIKCRHDFAASAADFRGAYKDPGAA